MVFPRRFRFYFVFFVVGFLSTFVLLSFYPRGVVRRLFATFYCVRAIQTSKTNLINPYRQDKFINF